LVPDDLGLVEEDRKREAAVCPLEQKSQIVESVDGKAKFTEKVLACRPEG
jgi:hypothetical protein